MSAEETTQEWIVTGFAEHNVGNYSESERLFRLAVEQDPHNSLPKIGVALALGARGQGIEAAQLISDVLNKALAEENRRFGAQWEQQGRLEDAAEAFGRALDHDRDALDVHFALATLWLPLNRLDDAERGCREALLSTPDSLPLLRLLGDVLERQDRADEAVQAYERWWSLPNNRLKSDRPRQAAAIERGIPPIVFVTMPKSASEYIPDVLAACLDIPAYFGGTHTFPRNRVIPRLTAISSRGGALLRLHMEACEANFAILKEAGIPRLVLHLRDPRQATLSWVHMLRRIDDKRFDLDRLSYTPVVRKDFRDFDLPDQLDWAMTNFYPRLIQWLTDWIDALPELERDMAVLVTTFEDFVDDPGKYLRPWLHFTRSSSITSIPYCKPTRQPARETFARERPTNGVRSSPGTSSDACGNASPNLSHTASDGRDDAIDR